MTYKEFQGYSICFNEWLFDTNIKNELHILLLISSLCAKEGFCFASNSYLAERFNIDEATISRKIKKLEKLNYINITYIKRGCEIQKREIRLTKLSINEQNYQSSIDENVNRTIDENVKDNNISINNISINNIGHNKNKTSSFIKPSLEEIKSFIQENYLNVNPETFFNYYESNGWKVGRNSMKNWKCAVRTWNSKNNNFESKHYNKPTEYNAYEKC